MPTVDEFRSARGTAPWLKQINQETPMFIELTITAVADRDPSCNLFTLTEAHRFSIAFPPNAEKIRTLCEEHKAKFLASWPHPRQAAPTLVALDATVTEKE